MKKLFFIAICALCAASCARSHYAVQGNSQVVVEKSDLVISKPMTATAKTDKILGIDWANLFVKKEGDASSTVVAGSNYPLQDRTANKALYKLLKENPGYDMVLYPVVETEGFSYVVMSTTEATVTARLAKIK